MNLSSSGHTAHQISPTFAHFNGSDPPSFHSSVKRTSPPTAWFVTWVSVTPSTSRRYPATSRVAQRLGAPVSCGNVPRSGSSASLEPVAGQQPGRIVVEWPGEPSPFNAVGDSRHAEPISASRRHTSRQGEQIRKWNRLFDLHRHRVNTRRMFITRQVASVPTAIAVWHQTSLPNLVVVKPFS
jgi:hypothetical protein